MASAGTGSSGFSGRRKSLDAEVNLVPFIDLLSMCICFLLMTAIWAEVNVISLKQLLGTEAVETQGKNFEVTIRLNGQNSIILDISEQGKKLNPIQIQGETMQAMLPQLSQHLTTFMSGIAAADAVVTGRVVPDVAVPYGELVSVLDTLRGNGVTQLGVVPVRE